jgi:1-acyl-sn-glycerol-3-phosphate acyltransferase
MGSSGSVVRALNKVRRQVFQTGKSPSMLNRSQIQWAWYQFAKLMTRIALSVMFPLRFTGCENVPAQGGALVLSNHQSHLDPPMLGVGCPRQMRFMARLSLFHFSPFGWLIQSLGAIPIDREGSALSGIRATIQSLRQGHLVLVFPEGTRSRGGEIGTFKPGLAVVARRAGVPIVPAAIEGAYDAWPRGASLPYRGTIHLHFGRPISPEEIRACNEQELAALVKSRVRECLSLLRQRPEFAQRRPEKTNFAGKTD